MPKASLVIRAKNEARHLAETLDAIFTQTERSFEVILVDSGSTDATLDIARRYPIRILSIIPEDFTYGRALNYGIANAEGQLIVCLSAHATPVDDGWLAALLSCFQNPLIAGAYGRQVPRDNVSFLELLGMRISGVTSLEARLQRKNMTFSNANGAIRRDLWQTCCFDEALAGAEDIVWAKQMLCRNLCIAYEPRAAVYHSHGEPLIALLRRQWRDYPVKLRLRFGANLPAARPARLGYPEKRSR